MLEIMMGILLKWSIFLKKIFTLHNEINNKQMWERERFTFLWNVNNLERDVKTSGGKFDDFDE